MAKPTAPICGYCGQARLVKSASAEHDPEHTIKPEGNVGVCPNCFHADVWDLDEFLAEHSASESEADAD